MNNEKEQWMWGLVALVGFILTAFGDNGIMLGCAMIVVSAARVGYMIAHRHDTDS